MVEQAAKHFVITMSEHDGAQRQTHHEEGKRLQTIEIAHSFLSGKLSANRLQQAAVTRKVGSPENDCTRSRSFDNVAPPAGVPIWFTLSVPHCTFQRSSAPNLRMGPKN
jgi:hypothetical protein